MSAVDTNGNESPKTEYVSATTQSEEEPPTGDYEEISLPFTYDGAGEFYWKTNDFCTDPNCWSHYMNSWNLELLEINGIDYTNRWVAQHEIAPANDGYWYIHYKGNYAWSHIEIR